MRLRFVARLGPRGSQLQPFMIGSFVLHAAAIVAFTIVPALRGSPPLDEGGFFVELVASPGPPASAAVQAPDPTPSSPPPPAPEPEPEPEVVPEGPTVEDRPVVETKEPPKEPEPKPEPPPRKPPVSETPPAESAGSGSGDPDGGLVLEEGGVGIGGGLEMGGSELSWYNGAVASALYNNWRQPGVSSAEPLKVVVRFEILRDGTVRGLQLAESSGVGILDRSVLRAVTNASPLPPIPRTWSGASITARYLFELNPEE